MRMVDRRRIRPASVRRLAAARPQGRPHAAARRRRAARSTDGDAHAAARRRSCRRRTARSSRERHDTDFAYEIPGLARFRANVFTDRKGPGAVFRVIPSEDPDGRTARAVAGHPAALQAEQGARAGHRPDRLGQVDDAVRDDRLHQPARATITSSRSRIRSSSCTRTRSA